MLLDKTFVLLLFILIRLYIHIFIYSQDIRANIKLLLVNSKFIPIKLPYIIRLVSPANKPLVLLLILLKVLLIKPPSIAKLEP
jgi:hypothetical protein